MIPESLLAQVLLRPAGHADDARPIRKLLDRLGVVFTHRRIDDPAGQEIDARYFGALGQGTGQLHHVEGLPPGVGVPAELEVLAPEQAVDAPQRQVKARAVLGAVASGLVLAHLLLP